MERKERHMTTTRIKSSVRRALLAGAFAVAGVLTIGAATAPAQAQDYGYQYNNPYYAAPYNYGYQNRYAWWRWHQYWRAYHQQEWRR
jgi:hypothetical protein